MQKKLHKTIVIIGPTASGKSDIAIHLAQKFGAGFTGGAAVIGVDSRQVYRHMDLGSGKEPGEIIDLTQTTQNLQSRHSCEGGDAISNTLHHLGYNPLLAKPYISSGVPHYMIDVADPTDDYSGGQFVADARNVLDALHETNALPIICGGTHFWVQSLVEKNAFPRVLPNPELRAKLAPLSRDELFAQLEAIDPRRAAELPEKNPVHLIRALEICAALGTVPESQSTPPSPDDTLILALTPDMETIAQNIAKRLPPRINAGMLDEVRALHDAHGVSWERLEDFGLEYKWCALFLQNKCSESNMHEGIIRESRQFAKRQLTWIRRWERSGAHIHHITTADEACALTQNFLHA